MVCHFKTNNKKEAVLDKKGTASFFFKVKLSMLKYRMVTCDLHPVPLSAGRQVAP